MNTVILRGGPFYLLSAVSFISAFQSLVSTDIWFVFAYLVSILVFAEIYSLIIHRPKTSCENVAEYAECERAAHERQKLDSILKVRDVRV